MDNISIKRLAAAHPKLRSELSDILIECEKANVGIRYTSVYRNADEQNTLYAQGRTTSGKIVTNAKAWESYHQYGLAVDIVLYHKDGSISYSAQEDLDKDGLADWFEVTAIFKKHGWEWAGDWKTFKERPHFQKTFGYKTSELYKMKVEGKTDSNKYVLI